MSKPNDTSICDASVRRALDSILADPKFDAAPQMSAFLRYVVEEALDGRADRIKAYTVAIDALGKPVSFDPQTDPSVRVLANRLRSSLDAYYARTSGHAVVIVIRSGSYKPHFLTAEQFFNESIEASAATNHKAVTAPPTPSPTVAAAAPESASAVVGTTPAVVLRATRQASPQAAETLDSLVAHRLTTSSGRRPLARPTESTNASPRASSENQTRVAGGKVPPSTREWLAMGKSTKAATAT